MIAQLTGLVAQVGPTSAVIEVGGFGIQAVCSPEHSGWAPAWTAGNAGDVARSCGRTRSTLYGFASADEREFFELLLTATGVGPKLAQAALAVLSPDELRSAIATENLLQLCKVPASVARVRNAWSSSSRTRSTRSAIPRRRYLRSGHRQPGARR